MNDGLRRLMGVSDIELLYAPQIEIGPMRVVGFEVLVRLQGGTAGEPLRLSRCAPSACGAPLVDALVEWTLETACRNIVEWAKAAGPLSLTINFPPTCLRAGDLIKRVLERTGLPAAQLEIELPARSYRAICSAGTRGFAEAGVSLSLEYRGEDALAEIDLAPFRKVKIRWLSDEPQFYEQFSSASADIRLAGREVVVDNVLSVAQLTAAAIAGCCVAQGDYLCVPLPEKNVSAYLRRCQTGIGHDFNCSSSNQE